VDNLGGEVLAWMASTMKQNGTIASVGLAASAALNTTVMPFILRGVNLLGVDSGYTAMALRRRVWSRLATDMRPRHLAELARTIAFDELPGVFDEFIAGRAHGRVVVSINSET
jgi:acrylyl-CoA reductase (NADPH)